MFRSSQILTVTFDPSVELAPLTVVEKQLPEQVELYLRRLTASPVDVAVSDCEPVGVAMVNGRPFAAFTFAPMGGTR